jgi:hypothetical protein
MRSLILATLFVCSTVVHAEDLLTYSWGWPLSQDTASQPHLRLFNLQPTGITYDVAFDTEVYSPCSGVVKVSDETSFDGLGALNPASKNYRGYALIIECLNAADEENYLVALLHLAPGSDVYDQFDHVGLAPVGSIVYKGQYVGRVNHYYANENDWPRLGFNLIKSQFKPEQLKDYLSVFEYFDWPELPTNFRTQPLAFIEENSLAATWFGDGSLVQVFGDEEIDLIIDGFANNVYDAETFDAYKFDRGKILYVKNESYKCLPKGEWQIEWAPAIELLKFDGTYYLLEKSCATCSNCLISELASKEAALSWNLNPTTARELSEAEADQWFNLCENKETAYLRDGAAVALAADASLEKFFLAHHNGYLSEFVDAPTFWLAGYDFDDLIVFDNEEDFHASFKSYGAKITEQMIFSCGQTFDLTEK